MSLSKITSFLFRPIDIASLVFFRIAFGIICFADVISSFIHLHITKKALEPDGFQFKYYGFEWVKPIDDPGMTIFFIGMLCTSIGILLGKWYRFSAAFFAIGFTYLFLLEKAYYLNHGYLLCVLSFLIVLMPLHRSFSIDVLKKPELRVEQVPYWSLFLLQLMIGIVYFYGGIAKLNMDWLNGLPLKLWLKNQANLPLIGNLLTQEWVAYLMSYGGLILDLTVTFFLIYRPTRIWALGFVLFFHGMNFILFQIGVFPFLSTTLSLLFFPPDFPKKVIRYFGDRFDRLSYYYDRCSDFIQQRYPHAQTIPLSSFNETWETQKKWIPPLLSFFILLQILIPLRHHYFEGPVAWTEEGHRYSWRMMLRSKNGYGHFEVIDPATNKRTKVTPDKYLSKRQKRKLFAHPDMILQFAHFLRDKHKAEGSQDVAIYAHIKTRLNGRDYQLYIDSTKNLAAIEWSMWEESDWIVPFHKVENE